MSYPQPQQQTWQTGEPPLWAPYYGAPFPAAVKRFWKKYTVFSGRASRSEYWWWALVSGLFFLFALIPAVGWIFLLLFTLMPSNPAGACFDQSAASGMTTP